MNITTFNPQIVTKDPEPVIKLFEELGFERRHKKEGIGKLDITAYRMMDENGFYIDISQANVGQPQDVITIRMNVDDYDAAYQLLVSHGFRNEFGLFWSGESVSLRRIILSDHWMRGSLAA